VILRSVLISAVRIMLLVLLVPPVVSAAYVIIGLTHDLYRVSREVRDKISLRVL